MATKRPTPSRMLEHMRKLANNRLVPLGALVALYFVATALQGGVSGGSGGPTTYAGSASPAGPATTALALNANGANCSAGSYPLGVDSAGAVESCTVAGGISGLGSADNAIVRTDGTGGATAQGSSSLLTDTGELQLATTARGIQFNRTADLLSSPSWGINTSSGSAVVLYGRSDDNTTSGTAWLGNLYATRDLSASPKAMVGFDGNGDPEVSLVSSGKIGFSASATDVLGGGAAQDTYGFRAAAGVYGFNKALQLTPAASPPVTCGDANTEGVIYNDTSHALCWCDASAWQKLSGAGTCA